MCRSSFLCGVLWLGEILKAMGSISMSCCLSSTHSLRKFLVTKYSNIALIPFPFLLGFLSHVHFKQFLVQHGSLPRRSLDLIMSGISPLRYIMCTLKALSSLPLKQRLNLVHFSILRIIFWEMLLYITINGGSRMQTLSFLSLVLFHVGIEPKLLLWEQGML